MAETIVVSPSNNGIKTKNVYLRMKNCSPQFKTVLRQRYQERVKNSRCELLNRFRLTHNEDTSSEPYPQHWSNLEYEVPTSETVKDVIECNEDFNLDEELLIEDYLNEELSQYENWLLQEYESLWNDEDNDEIIITCPLCCSGRFEVLDVSANVINCTRCHFTFTTKRSMLEIQNDIFSEVDKHNLNCSSDPAFVQVPGDGTYNNLCIVCDICVYLQLII